MIWIIRAGDVEHRLRTFAEFVLRLDLMRGSYRTTQAYATESDGVTRFVVVLDAEEQTR